MQPKTIRDIYNYIKISDLISTSGQPLEDEMLLIKNHGFEMIIYLALFENSELPNEKEIAQKLGLEFIHIPVIFKAPKLDDFKDFVKIINKYQSRKIFIHCEVNMRVSVFMALYRIIEKNMGYDEAMDWVAKIWTPDEVWKAFIHNTLKHYNQSV